MPETIHQVPLTAIDADALVRDRSTLEAETLAELRRSIAANGLRLPLELFDLSEPDGPLRYGLISGYRRLAALRGLFELTGQGRYATAPAVLRAPADLGAALAAMVEENEIRTELSPWERGRTALSARDQGVFGTVEEAVEKLYPSATRQKRARLRSFAHVVEELDGHLAAPESLNQRQCTRLATALSRGFGELVRTALAETHHRDADSQWQLVKPILEEAESLPADAPHPFRTGRPRRLVRLRQALTVRREMTRDGYLLRFTGREATSPLLDEVLDQIERMYSPE